MQFNYTDNGHIYALTVGERTKIGRAKKDPEGRVNAMVRLWGLSKDDCQISYFQTGMHTKVEAKCHKLAHNHSLKGEWFSLSHSEACKLIATGLRAIEFIPQAVIDRLEKISSENSRETVNSMLLVNIEDDEKQQESALDIALSNYSIAFEKRGDKYVSINPLKDVIDEFDSFFDAVVLSQIYMAKFDVEECDQEPDILPPEIFSPCFDGALEVSEEIINLCGEYIVQNIGEQSDLLLSDSIRIIQHSGRKELVDTYKGGE